MPSHHHDTGYKELFSHPEFVQQLAAVDRLVAILQADPDKQRIDKIITRWLKRHLAWLGTEVNLAQLDSLMEDKDMLAENLENLVKKERLEGRQEGRQEGEQVGIQKGRQEGERYGLQKGRLAEARDVLRTQLGLKFGEVPDWVETQLMQADHEQLQQWMREVLFADRLDTMFTR